MKEHEPYTRAEPTALKATPRLEGLLVSLRGRMRRLVLLHGVGTLLLLGTLWLVFAFFADWGLRVPKLVRIFHGLVLVGLSGFLAWRFLLRPLARIPMRSGLALLYERANPDLRELFISAVQFQATPRGAEGWGDPSLIHRVLAEAEDRAARLEPTGVLAVESPKHRFLFGAAAAGGLAVLAFFNAQHTGIFLNRMLGGDLAWPQRTVLTLEIPDLENSAHIERTEERLYVRVARGTDVPVIVRADGVVPDDIMLHFEGGRDLVLQSGSGGVFRTLLRSLQTDIAFHATGGDDRDGLPQVEIEVLQPPDIEGVAIEIVPPAYSGLEPTVVFNRDVEVLAGSNIRVHAQPFPADATGVVRLLPDDLPKELVSSTFPVDPAADDGSGEPQRGLSFELIAEKTVGFRFELQDITGLSNPDPGLFRIRVIEDRVPEIQVLAPARTEFEIVKGGAIPLRARAEDDFGVESMDWSIVSGSSALSAGEDEQTPLLQGSFELRDLERDAEGGLSGSRHVVLGNVRIEVNDLGTEEAPVTVDERFQLILSAGDTRRPEPGEGRSVPIRARVVTPEELLRRMQDRLAEARLRAIRLSDLQQEKRSRAEELLDAIEGDNPLQAGDNLALAAALSGQRHVQSDAQALARDLAGVTEDILYARIDEKAGALLESYDARMRDVSDLSFHAEPLRELARARREGLLAAGGFAGSLVELVDLALEISEDRTAAATLSLSRAEEALRASDIQAALLETVELQTEALKRMEDLLERLAEWDNFQNILSLTRDILNRQKALRDRTQQFATGK